MCMGVLSVLDLIEKVRSWIGISVWMTNDGNNVKLESTVVEDGGKERTEGCTKPRGIGMRDENVSSRLKEGLNELGCEEIINCCSEGILRLESPRADQMIRDAAFQTMRREIVYNDNCNSFQSHHLARFLEVERKSSSPTYSMGSSGVASSSEYLSPISVNRSDEEDLEDTERLFLSPFSEYCLDITDIHSTSLSGRDEFYNYKSVGSSPFDSPSRIANNYTDTHIIQEVTPSLRSPERETGQNEDLHKPLDFEDNCLLWCPPQPDDPDDDRENTYFEEEDDDEDESGRASGMLSSCSSFRAISFPVKAKPIENQKVHGHFRALVAQLLQEEGIYTPNGDCGEGWLDIVTAIAWRAATFVKPDTNRGGTMDPGDYVKVKCISSGSPTHSTMVKGVVCTKNIKHKRMTSHYKNPKLLLLGGSLEYEKSSNHLASFDNLLQQEIDHLKMVISKIEAHHPNVLLVEKTVSSYAQEYLLAKEISLVLNVKKPLLERIARCTGAFIIPSTEKLSSARLGYCENFRLERTTEDCVGHENNKKTARTLMFFEGCPKRLGCTILLKGACREVLKKIKHVVQYAVFAAYHLSLETSFLVDEGATLPNAPVKALVDISQRPLKTEGHDLAITDCTISDVSATSSGTTDVLPVNEVSLTTTSELSEGECLYKKSSPQPLSEDRVVLESSVQGEGRAMENQMNIGESNHELLNVDSADESESLSDHPGIVDNHPSILVSFSNRSVLKGTVCGSQLLRIKFYGNFDKPLGRHLRENLFNKEFCCKSCKGSTESHVRCYIHQQGNLTINVRRLPSVELSGERDGKIWMWHRCLRCVHVDGVPPANRRVLMSDAACGLSFGKFLELSFSNHATANRLASCGHLLQRDCLRYYGCGDMVALFCYVPIDIFSICLPPLHMQFKKHVPQKWIKVEAIELSNKMELLFKDISAVFHNIKQKGLSSGVNSMNDCDIQNHIADLNDLLGKERNEYRDVLNLAGLEDLEAVHVDFDILELNRLRRCLLIDCYIWDRRLYCLETLLNRNGFDSCILEATTYVRLAQLRNESFYNGIKLEHIPEDLSLNRLDQKKEPITLLHSVSIDVAGQNSSNIELTSSCVDNQEVQVDGHDPLYTCLSDQIDSAWTGTVGHISQIENPSYRRLNSPMRVHSFDSAVRTKERISRGLAPSTLRVSSLKSIHASGHYGNITNDPTPHILRTFSQTSPGEPQNLNTILTSLPSILPSASYMTGEGVRFILPLTGHNNIVIPVYDNEPTSVISYALSSKEYENRITYKLDEHNGRWNNTKNVCSKLSSSLNVSCPSLVSLEPNKTLHRSHGSDDTLTPIGTLFSSPKKSPHFTFSFEDDTSLLTGKVKFSSTVFFAQDFHDLRMKCCPSEVDYVRSLSRCTRWHAEGGKSNVFFARSLDERLIVKQVTRTELDSFMVFAHEYFNHLSNSIDSGSPTCLSKILGVYHVTVKHFKSGRETKMDLMVMENLFFGRNISKMYDLKGSTRSRYIVDDAGKNKVLLDMNMLETLCTNPIFLGKKAKRSLERAVWNDTSFLAAIDVMDYSLLVGVDIERQELVIGIIDFMRQYTWDKHLETWVKSSGILGGPRNASPTVISPVQYKKRFRKAMSAYFLTIADNWSS